MCIKRDSGGLSGEKDLTSGKLFFFPIPEVKG